MKHLRILVVLIIIIVVGIVAGGAAYGWWLGQKIYVHMFNSKAHVDFWQTWTLKNNVFTASLLLAILSSLFTLWTRSTSLSFISALSQTGSHLKKLDIRTGVVWRLLELGAFFVYYVSIGGYAITGQNVAFLLMLTGDGSISITPGEFATLFSLPFAPGTTAASIQSLVPAMEAYQLYVGLISTVIVATAVRLVLSIITDMMLQRRDIFVIVSKGLVVVSLALVLEILSVPTWTVNAGTWMSYLALIIALGASIVGSVAFMAVRVRSGDAHQRLRSKIASLEGDLARLQGELLSLRQEYEAGAINAEDYRQRVNLLMQDRVNISNELRRLKIERLLPLGDSQKSFVAVSIFLIAIVVMLPIVQGLYYGIQMNGDRYIDWKFNFQTNKEIEITNWAAGLSDSEVKPIDALTLNASPASDVERLTNVRQWDETASLLRMKNQIGTNWMQLADSDIVLLKDHEYWIAPLTFDTSATWTSFINQHILYTHTEGIVVLDAFSGELVEDEHLISLFNRTADINFYYGEGRGFSDEVFVNVPNFQEVGNATFEGTPDYALRGFESFYYILTMGPQAWSYLGKDMDMLVERDVVSRVQSIMLQGLSVDQDTYVVVDPSGNIYYAASVYIDYPLSTGYAHENYMRFMGVCLVDIETGEMTFHLAPTETESLFLDTTYRNYYNWTDTPGWLQSQLKWPEDLYERQLHVAYIYHVNSGEQWSTGVDFHQSPEDSDTRYVIMTIEGVQRFVAYHNAEFLQTSAHNLAGVYIMGCGDTDFGKFTFYKAGEDGYSNWLGPTAAVQAFETNDIVRTQLQLWGEHRYGNRLLYQLGGDLFFVVPVFLEVETSVNRVIQKLGGVGLVDIKTGDRVQLGENVVEAYYKMFGLLNKTVVESGEVGFESVTLDPVTINSGEQSSLITLMRNNHNITQHLYLDIVIFSPSANFSVSWHGSDILSNISATNQTFTMDIGLVGAGDLYGTSPLLTAFLPSGAVLIQYLILVVLRTDAGVVDEVSLPLTIT
jgi:hypothetical protein